MKFKTTFFLIIFLLMTSFFASAYDKEIDAKEFSFSTSSTSFSNHNTEAKTQNFSNDINSAKVLSITCSLFPVYDFTRAITGNLANVRLLLKPGVEPHEFEPSALDVKALNDSDVFIFTDKAMEGWAERISRSLTHTEIINASENITLIDNDPHIWLDLSLAQKMLMNIAEKLCVISPENSETFTNNAKSYCSKLAELDEKFYALNKNKSLVFAGEFSCQYFLRRYGFNYISAYEAENEPSIKKLAQVMKFIQQNRTRYIFSEPLEISQVTRSISEETGAKILTFDTCHKVKDENITFLEIMTGNYENLARALNE